MIPEEFPPSNGKRSPKRTRNVVHRKGGMSIVPVETIRALMKADGSLDPEAFARWRALRSREGAPSGLQNLAEDILRAQGFAHLQALNDALLDLALGHWVEKSTPEGEKKVYKQSPHFNALKEMLNRTVGPPTSHDEVAFNLAKAKAMWQEWEAKLAFRKGDQFDAQTERAIVDTRIYAMSQMDEKEIGRKFKSLLNVCLAWVTMIPRTTMQAATESDATWQQYKADFGTKLKARARDILLSDDGGDLQAAITAAKEEEAEDG